jgi:hypothetical protein
MDGGISRGRRVAAPPARTFDDVAGLEWQVTEHEAEAGSTLVFMSASAMRRVVHYPDNWRLLTAKELEALSWRR